MARNVSPSHALLFCSIFFFLLFSRSPAWLPRFPGTLRAASLAFLREWMIIPAHGRRNPACKGRFFLSTFFSISLRLEGAFLSSGNWNRTGGGVIYHAGKALMCSFVITLARGKNYGEFCLYQSTGTPILYLDIPLCFASNYLPPWFNTSVMIRSIKKKDNHTFQSLSFIFCFSS